MTRKSILNALASARQRSSPFVEPAIALAIEETGVRRGARMIRKLKSGDYRLYSRKKDPRTGKRRNLGTFGTRRAAEKHEREVQFFKRGGRAG
jgi:hypothetical protein